MPVLRPGKTGVTQDVSNVRLVQTYIAALLMCQESSRYIQLYMAPDGNAAAMLHKSYMPEICSLVMP